MYDIFLETKACKQIEHYAKAYHLSKEKTEAIKRSCYNNANKYLKLKSQTEIDDYWIDQCLDHEKHKLVNIDSAMLWIDTPEGQDFWSDVNDY